MFGFGRLTNCYSRLSRASYYRWLFQVKSLVASGALPQLRGGYGKTTKKARARLKFMYIFNPSFKTGHRRGSSYS